MPVSILAVDPVPVLTSRFHHLLDGSALSLTACSLGQEVILTGLQEVNIGSEVIQCF